MKLFVRNIASRVDENVGTLYDNRIPLVVKHGFLRYTVIAFYVRMGEKIRRMTDCSFLF